MIIFDILESIFNILVPFALVISLFISFGELVSKENVYMDKRISEENTIRWHDNVKIFLSILSILVVTGIIVVVFIKYKIKWLAFVLALPMYLERVTGIYISIGILKDVVNSNDKKSLSKREYLAIQTIAYAVWFLGLYDFHEKILNLGNQITNLIIADIVQICSCLVLFFIYVFFICAIIPSPLFEIIKVLSKIIGRLPGKEKMKRIEKYFIAKTEIDKMVCQNLVLIILLEKIKNKKIYIKSLGYILCPVCLVIDIILGILLTGKNVIISAIGNFCHIFGLIRKTIRRMADEILGMSDKHIVAISFRIALIAAFVFTVILNRYEPFLKLDEASTGVLEFLASTVIIPIIFEWIYSYKQNSEQSNEE